MQCPTEAGTELIILIGTFSNLQKITKQKNRKLVEREFDRNKLAKDYLDLLVNLSNHAN